MDIFSVSKNQLLNFILKNNEKKFRAKQIFQWLYQKKIESFDSMTNTSKNFRDLFKKEFSFSTIKLKNTHISSDKQTYKFIWELEDSHFIESVLILSGNRRTLCISSQVGCKGACVFCSSGKKGFLRNLKTSEIVEQVVNVDKYLSDKDERISNIVFMGMGEPLDNFDAVIKSVQIINDEDGLNISQRKITISTVGLIDKIAKLSETQNISGVEGDDFTIKVNLTLSLHAPTQEIREKLLPLARKNNFYELIQVMKKYYLKTKRDITFEYILIEGVNDQLSHAKSLLNALGMDPSWKGHFSLNLIPYNKVIGLDFCRPDKEVIEAFKETLEEKGIKVTQRYAKGNDIAAACGQLAFLQKKNNL